MPGTGVGQAAIEEADKLPVLMELIFQGKDKQ